MGCVMDFSLWRPWRMFLFVFPLTTASLACLCHASLVAGWTVAIIFPLLGLVLELAVEWCVGDSNSSASICCSLRRGDLLLGAGTLAGRLCESFALFRKIFSWGVAGRHKDLCALRSPSSSNLSMFLLTSLCSFSPSPTTPLVLQCGLQYCWEDKLLSSSITLEASKGWKLLLSVSPATLFFNLGVSLFYSLVVL